MGWWMLLKTKNNSINSISISNKLSLIEAQIQREVILTDEEEKQLLLSMIKPAIGIRTSKSSDHDLAVGASKIGGRPDLPLSFTWPLYKDEPLTFCAQYNCAELTHFDPGHVLPSAGMIYVFIYIDKNYPGFLNNKASYKVIYADAAHLGRSEFPGGYFEEGIFETACIDFYEFFTIPDEENYKLAKMKKWNDYFDAAHEKATDIINAVTGKTDNRHHQLLGDDRSVQSSVVFYFAERALDIRTQEAYERHKAELNEMQKEFMLLLQLDCHDQNTNLSKFGGSMVIYFGLKPAELKGLQFDQAVMAFQSS